MVLCSMLLAALPPEAYLAMGFIVLIATIFIVRRRSFRRMREAGAYSDSSGAPESKVHNHMEKLLLEIQEVSRDQIAKADTKIRMLNQLIMESDERKKELEILLGKLASIQVTSAAPLSTATPPPKPKAANPLHEKVFTLQDEGKNSFEISGATGLEIGEVEMILGLRKL